MDIQEWDEESEGVLSDADVKLLRQLDSLYQGATKVAIKKLSKNDRSWARPGGSHQAGFYVSDELRGDFFPADHEIQPQERIPHILEMKIRTKWPGFIELKEMTYKRYTNKGGEAHFTVPPKSAFSEVAPASFVVMAKKTDADGEFFECLVVDSNAAFAYESVERKFDLFPTFLVGVFDPPVKDAVPAKVANVIDLLIQEFVTAAHNKTLPQLIKLYSKIPDGSAITAEAQATWLQGTAEKDFNPFRLEAPGNVLRKLTTEIEFEIYRAHELRYRAAQALEIIFRDGVSPTTTQIVERVVRNFIHLYQVMLNASQQRKNRVGAGFESHIQKMLIDGKIPHEEQAVVSTRRPDFVLPNKELYVAHSSDALVLAAKTTLRERWKQVPREQRNCVVYLATMDEKVTLSAVKEMAQLDIVLVVPESLVTDKIIEYAKEPNVMTFKKFFDSEIALSRKPRWMALGAWK